MDALWTARLSPRTGNGRSHAPRHGAFETPAGRPDGSVVAECAPPGAGAGAPACGCVRDGGSRAGVRLGRRPRSPCPFRLGGGARCPDPESASPGGVPSARPCPRLHPALGTPREPAGRLHVGSRHDCAVGVHVSALRTHCAHAYCTVQTCMHAWLHVHMLMHTYTRAPTTHVHIHVRAVHTCTHLQDVHTFLHTVCTLLMNIRMHKRRCTYLRAHAHTSHTDTHACSDRTSPSPSSRWSQAVPSGL